MKCPHCEYENGHKWDDEGKFVELKGNKGEFFKQLQGLNRGSYLSGIDVADIIGCPNCKLTFIDT